LLDWAEDVRGRGLPFVCTGTLPSKGDGDLEDDRFILDTNNEVVFADFPPPGKGDDLSGMFTPDASAGDGFAEPKKQ